MKIIMKIFFLFLLLLIFIESIVLFILNNSINTNLNDNSIVKTKTINYSFEKLNPPDEYFKYIKEQYAYAGYLNIFFKGRIKTIYRIRSNNKDLDNSISILLSREKFVSSDKEIEIIIPKKTFKKTKVYNSKNNKNANLSIYNLKEKDLILIEEKINLFNDNIIDGIESINIYKL